VRGMGCRRRGGPSPSDEVEEEDEDELAEEARAREVWAGVDTFSLALLSLEDSLELVSLTLLSPSPDASAAPPYLLLLRRAGRPARVRARVGGRPAAIGHGEVGIRPWGDNSAAAGVGGGKVMGARRLCRRRRSVPMRAGRRRRGSEWDDATSAAGAAEPGGEEVDEGEDDSDDDDDEGEEEEDEDGEEDDVAAAAVAARARARGVIGPPAPAVVPDTGCNALLAP